MNPQAASRPKLSDTPVALDTPVKFTEVNKISAVPPSPMAHIHVTGGLSRRTWVLWLHLSMRP